MNIRIIIGKAILLIPAFRGRQFAYKFLGVHAVDNCNFFMAHPTVIGDYHYLYMHENSRINKCCMILARARIEIGENSGLAYGATILTGADPRNELNKLYAPQKAPVIIGKNCWIGANSTILPGVTIGDYCIVAAGAVVTKDVPSGVLVAGNPAVIKKHLDIQKIISN